MRRKDKVIGMAKLVAGLMIGAAFGLVVACILISGDCDE